ncbi:MAG: hypothetical protein LBM38_00730 [Clostridiales bacterium]|nr:hypothetical protein [Clostridiales bacterium]
MLNYIWSALMIISIICAAALGRLGEVTSAAIDGAASAITTAITLLGIMCMWSGFMSIAEQSGLVKLFAILLRPLTKWIFPELPKNSKALNSVTMNMTANLLGMSNAATPLGLAAMEELDRENGHSPHASNSICAFVVVNTASFQLIPASIISLRQTFGGGDPYEIIAPVWIASAIALIVGITVAKMMQRN